MILKIMILPTPLKVHIKLKLLSDSMRSTVTLIQHTIMEVTADMEVVTTLEIALLMEDTGAAIMHTNIKTIQQMSPLNSTVLLRSIVTQSTTKRASTLPIVNSTSRVNTRMSMEPMTLASRRISKTGGIISLRYLLMEWPPPVF